MKKGYISIIIVNWNGLKWLKNCFDSLIKQTYTQYEIIFVEDASDNQKETIEFVEKKYPHVQIVVNSIHTGFAGGNNKGLTIAKGEYILMLNNDTVQESDYLEQLVHSMNKYPRAASIQSKLVLMNDKSKLDVCGSYWTDTTILHYIGLGKAANKKEYNEPKQFFSNKGASMMVRKSVIDSIGFLDDDFWTYYEETDFCHRAWLSGYEVWYTPNAVCYHANGGTSAIQHNNSLIMFHNLKNKLNSYIKNFEYRNLLYIIPFHIAISIVTSMMMLLQGKWKHGLVCFTAIGWNILHISSTVKKRSVVQHKRKISDASVFGLVKKNPPWRYYLYFFIGLEKYQE